jgi:RimJ/RimL family protein N-acetyltransferase
MPRWRSTSAGSPAQQIVDEAPGPYTTFATFRSRFSAADGQAHTYTTPPSAAQRGQGYGRRLLALAEQAAQERGCRYAQLTTYSFQARGFYEKAGYRVVGALTDYPPGETYYWLRKDFAG